jgi:putative mRNA 3-end processing factor
LCDHLVTETTFASPEYLHPDPAAEIFRLADRKANVVIGAYAVGKAQRLTAMISKLCPEIPLYIHPELITYHRIYENHGFALGEWKPYRRVEFKNETSSFYIVSPSQFNRFSRNKNVLKVFATGWKQSYYACDEVLSISDHADWNDLLLVVKNSGAKHVYTVHGDGSHLKNYLAGTNIGVTILS